MHGLNPFVDTRFVAYARTSYENRSYHHKAIDIIGRDEYKSETKPARKVNIKLSRDINNKNAPPQTTLINKSDITHFDIITQSQDDMKYNLNDDSLPDYSKAMNINKRSNDTNYKLIKLSNVTLISRLRDEFITFVELFRYFWKSRIHQKIMDDFKYAYDIYNYRHLHDNCMQIMILLKKNKNKDTEKYIEDLEKVKKIKKDIISNGIKSLKKLCKIYNDGIKYLQYHGNSMIDTKGIETKLIIYRKRLIEWTISGNFSREYVAFKKYYKNKYGHNHYPKSAEYARISLKRHAIYHGVEDIIKLMTVYYVCNAPQPATESKQKLLMKRDIDRYHTDRAKIEMESVATGGISKNHNNEDFIIKTALKCVQSGKNPFVASSIKLISPVLDRRINATKKYESRIPDIDFVV